MAGRAEGLPVLVVGATGALRPAALALAARGVPVLALARREGPLAALRAEGGAGLLTVTADHHDPAALARALPAAVGAALLYCPGAPADSLALFGRRAHGRVVELLTSGAADPALVGDRVEVSALTDATRVAVLLGWADGSRWHTPEEISAAALAALDDGRPRVLGRVRPWAGRPAS